jgi:hypothetical protein
VKFNHQDYQGGHEGLGYEKEAVRRVRGDFLGCSDVVSFIQKLPFFFSFSFLVVLVGRHRTT